MSFRNRDSNPELKIICFILYNSRTLQQMYQSVISWIKQKQPSASSDRLKHKHGSLLRVQTIGNCPGIENPSQNGRTQAISSLYGWRPAASNDATFTK